MKTTLLTLVLFMISINIYSQNLVQDNKIWNVVNCMNWGGCWTESFKIDGDTTIDQTEYKKLLRTTDTTLTNWGFFAAIREVDNRVFIKYPSLDSENILYDFNLLVGETFSGFYYDCPFELVLQEIDTITLLNGEQREKFIFSDGEQWIKGIGSLYGLIYVGVYWCEADMYYDLSCCFENGEQIFQSDNYESCFTNTVGVDEKNKQTNYKIYPNPFTNSAIIKFNYSDSQDYILQIINQSGQIIQTLKNITSGEIEIKKGDMKNGVYFYRLQNSNGIVAKGKMIIK